MALNLGGGQHINRGTNSAQLLQQGAIFRNQAETNAKAQAALELQKMKEEADQAGWSMKRVAEIMPDRFKAASSVLFGGGDSGTNAAEKMYMQVLQGPETEQQLGKYLEDKEAQRFGDLPFSELGAGYVDGGGITVSGAGTSPNSTGNFTENAPSPRTNSEGQPREFKKVDSQGHDLPEDFINDPEGFIKAQLSKIGSEGRTTRDNAYAAFLAGPEYQKELIDWMTQSKSPVVKKLLDEYNAILAEPDVKTDDPNQLKSVRANAKLAEAMKLIEEHRDDENGPLQAGYSAGTSGGSWKDKNVTGSEVQQAFGNPEGFKETIATAGYSTSPTDYYTRDHYIDEVSKTMDTLTPEEQAKVRAYLRDKATGMAPDVLDDVYRMDYGIGRHHMKMDDWFREKNAERTGNRNGAPLLSNLVFTRGGSAGDEFVPPPKLGTMTPTDQATPQQQEENPLPPRPQGSQTIDTYQEFLKAKENSARENGNVLSDVSGRIREADLQQADINQKNALSDVYGSQETMNLANTELAYQKAANAIATSEKYDDVTKAEAIDVNKAINDVLTTNHIPIPKIEYAGNKELLQNWWNGLSGSQQRKYVDTITKFTPQIMSNKALVDNYTFLDATFPKGWVRGLFGVEEDVVIPIPNYAALNNTYTSEEDLKQLDDATK